MFKTTLVYNFKHKVADILSHSPTQLHTAPYDSTELHTALQSSIRPHTASCGSSQLHMATHSHPQPHVHSPTQQHKGPHRPQSATSSTQPHAIFIIRLIPKVFILDHNIKFLWIIPSFVTVYTTT